MNRPRRWTRVLRWFAIGVLLTSSPVMAEKPAAVAVESATISGLEIMRRADELPEGRDFFAVATWRLIEPGGGERVRETRIFRRTIAGKGAQHRSKWLVLVDKPRLVKGIGLLVWSGATPGDPDEQWLYLPSYRRVRRIAGRDREEAFLGSDFSFADLSDRGVDEDTHRYLRQEAIDGVAYSVVESVPLDRESVYEKRMHWVDSTRSTVRRIELYARNGRLAKTLDLRWQRIGGIWTWKRLEMTSHRSGHRTVIDFADVKHDQGLDDKIFTKNSLRLGVH